MFIQFYKSEVQQNVCKISYLCCYYFYYDIFRKFWKIYGEMQYYVIKLMNVVIILLWFFQKKNIYIYIFLKQDECKIGFMDFVVV